MGRSAKLTGADTKGLRPAEILRLRNLKTNWASKRCFCVEYLGEGWIQWECRHGHQFKKRVPRWERMQGFLRRMTKADGYWSRRGGGCGVLCPQCWQEARQQFRETRK
jgi:hypothetical protein